MSNSMSAPTGSHDAARRAALEVHRRLCPVYGCPIPYFNRLDPLEELVSSFLNHRTRNRVADRAFRTLRDAFPDWAAVRDAPTDAVERLIAGVTWPEQKAPRLQAILRAVHARVGAFDLAFLGEMPVPEARAWLEALPGVGPKTSAAVLSFSTLRRPALPVDSHHHRVAQRLGLIPDRMAVGPSHAVLGALVPPDWDAQQVYDHHQVFMRHGQKVCHWRAPDCHRCVLRDMCPTANPDRPDFPARPAAKADRAPDLPFGDGAPPG